MLFSSAIFLFLFLPIVLIVYYLAPKRLRNLILLLASLAFYTWGEQKMVVLIVLSAMADYGAGLLITKFHRKIGLACSILFNLGILLYFKYASFAFENLQWLFQFFGAEPLDISFLSGVALPLGISFYTFQTMSYTIDVYRGNIKPTTNFIDFATYVTLFPQLVAGPIVRYKDVAAELQERTTSLAQFSEGVRRFIIGLGKKMIIANNLAFAADGAFGIPTDQLSTVFAWLGVVAYMFQIYFDFSGYSDMAIGLGKMFGFNFPENFNYPYIAKSIKEFWRRWHISLSNWFRDYLYISLGGNRISKQRTLLNLLIVFFLTGLWHGAEWKFIVWGLWHGLFLLFERAVPDKWTTKIPKAIKHIYAIIVVMLGWVFFRAGNLELAVQYIDKMVVYVPETMENGVLAYYFRVESCIALSLAVLFSIPLVEKVKLKYEAVGRSFLWIEHALIIFVLLISCMYIAVDAYNPFIYFRF